MNKAYVLVMVKVWAFILMYFRIPQFQTVWTPLETKSLCLHFMETDQNDGINSNLNKHFILKYFLWISIVLGSEINKKER